MPRLQAACCAQSGGASAPAVFPVQPDFTSLAILKPTGPTQPQPQLDLRSLNFKAPRAGMSRISLHSPRACLVEQRFCRALSACSPNGAWLLSAQPSQPTSLQCWNVPESRVDATLIVPTHRKILGVSWSSNSQQVAITFLCPQQQDGRQRRVVHTYTTAGAQLGASAMYSTWRPDLGLGVLEFTWQPRGSEYLAGLADNALLVLAADCSVAARVPVDDLLGLFPMPVLPDDVMSCAWVPDSHEVAVYREHGMINVMNLTYVSVGPVMGQLRLEKAPFPVCYPVFGARGRIAGTTARDPEVIIAHTAPGDPGEALYTGISMMDSFFEQHVLAWSPSADLLAVGSYSTGSQSMRAQTLRLLDGATGQQLHKFAVDAVSKIPLGLEALGAAGADALFGRRKNVQQRVSWSSSGAAVRYSLLLHMADGSCPAVGMSSHFVVQLGASGD